MDSNSIFMRNMIVTIRQQLLVAHDVFISDRMHLCSSIAHWQPLCGQLLWAHDTKLNDRRQTFVDSCYMPCIIATVCSFTQPYVGICYLHNIVWESHLSIMMQAYPIFKHIICWALSCEQLDQSDTETKDITISWYCKTFSIFCNLLQRCHVHRAN